jgi:hypothetical protein
VSAIDGLGEHQSGLKLRRDCPGCLALTGRVRHYECQVCFRMIPWCNGAADDLDEAFGGICDQCAEYAETKGGEP